MIKKLSLIALISLTSNYIFPDATDDLFTAIEQCDVYAAEKALADGADVLQPRADNNTPLSLAYAKKENKIKALNSYTGKLPSLAGFGILIAALLHNPKLAVASIASNVGSNFIEATSGAKLALKFGLNVGGAAVLLGTAWKSEQKVLAGVGTAGLIISAYQIVNMTKQNHIYDLIEAAAVNKLMVLQDTQEAQDQE